MPIGVTRDFVSYGGNGVKAERVTRLLSVRTGRPLDRMTLFERSTVELMADLLRDAMAVTGPVRVLREAGADSGGVKPLFFFHPGGGDTAVFRQLVDLRRIQPSGPYRLLGWSFGGFLAFEAAKRLDLAGERVELLGMVDPILPLPPETGLSEVHLLERRFARFGEFLESSYGGSVELPFAERSAGPALRPRRAGTGVGRGLPRPGAGDRHRAPPVGARPAERRDDRVAPREGTRQGAVLTMRSQPGACAA
ncbi:MAG: hypothetical protein JWQ81_228 [Amycolatopsis sp.]|uniref:thioesterase domain-containing protein n=1 Tax=Amycolatopsis sp. TaxID=37632 RepID=UPI002637EA13|nr:thioesterase domain-containing protein [Amycolatopsis sp.]MCU1679489.1 hypothetical protein [Amycolatopsis sp.]